MKLPIGAPYQLINGCLVDWPSRTVDHQTALGNLTLTCMNYSDAVSLDGLFIIGPIEVVLDDSNSFQPDLIYISKENDDIIKDYIYGPPDIVFEVLWDKNAYYDLRPKKDVYEKYGVKEYIIVDPIAFTFESYTLNNGNYQLHQKAGKTEKLNSVILPGLTFDLSKIFA